MDDFTACSTSRTYPIAELRSVITLGQFRIPQFQRSPHWEAQGILNLFDSILRGYPLRSLLLWQREADANDLRVGTLEARAEARPDALWVIDDQQRITSLVNAADPRGTTDRRFVIGCSLRAQKVVLTNRREESLVIPPPDFFDPGRALEWLGKNPDVSIYAELTQNVAGRLNRLAVPTTVLEQADESAPRGIFDRTNSRGKRLNPAEIFDVIHGEPDRGSTTSGIAAYINEQTRFGRLDDKVVVQALLVRRHPDITHDLHNEFSPSRRNANAFPEENKEEAYEETERALVSVIRSPQQTADVPHMTFLPYRLQLLVLTRFFALFPKPRDRSLELMRRWLWRTSVGAETFGIMNSLGDLRDMAKLVTPGKESSSVQRLIKAAELTIGPGNDFTNFFDLTAFRTSRGDPKTVLTTLWNRHPVDVRTNLPMTPEKLADQLGDDSTPHAATTKLVPDSTKGTGSAANHLIPSIDHQEFIAHANTKTDPLSLLLDEQMLSTLQKNRHGDFLRLRSAVLRRYLAGLLSAHTARGHEDTPPPEE